jgi:hypothetical protein
MKKANVTKYEFALLRPKAFLKNEIKVPLTHVTKPNTKNNSPIMINGPV